MVAQVLGGMGTGTGASSVCSCIYSSAKIDQQEWGEGRRGESVGGLKKSNEAVC